MVKKTVSLCFADYIKMLPSAWVFEYFIKGIDTSRKILSSSMIDEAVVLFNSPDSLNQQFLRLSPKQKLRCALVYLFGDTGLSLESSDPFEEPLVLSFLTFAAKKDGKIHLFGFDEFLPSLKTAFVETILEASIVSDQVSSGSVWPWRPLNDLALIASLASQGILQKKRSGGISRTASLQIKKLSDTGADLKVEGTDYPANLAIAYLMSKNIVWETLEIYRLDNKEFLNWTTLPLETRKNDFLDFAFEYSGSWSVELFLELIKTCGSNYISSSIFSDSDRKCAINTLRALRFAGLIELRRNGDEFIFSSVIEQTPAIEPKSGSAIIMPDFSAVIPQESDIDQLYRFSQLGLYESFDKVYHGKIDKAVLFDSLSRGTDQATIMQWLSLWQAPSNVLETVREWIREFLRLYIIDRCILVSNDEKVSLQIEAYEPLRLLLSPVSAHAIYVVEKGNELKAREILQTLGFDYRMPGQDSTVEPASTIEEPVSLIPVESWSPVVEMLKVPGEAPASMRGTKYGGELKALDTSEMVHVIDYSILTGQKITFDYEGSPYIKPGIYTITPLSCQKGIDPTIEGELVRTKSRKQFYMKKIRKIGVVQR